MGGASMPQLTKRVIDGIKLDTKETVIWDDELSGFGLRIKPSGRKTYVVQYRGSEKISRRLTLGTHGPMTPEQARRAALQVLAAVQRGEDPVADVKAGNAAPTMNDLADRYLEQHAASKKKASSARKDQDNLRLHIRTQIGRKKVADITRVDIASLHHAMHDTPGAANRVLALLSKMFNLSEKWGLRPDGTNPCRHVERYPERRMERFLSDKEFAALGQILDDAERSGTEPTSVIGVVRLLLFTGARLSEIQTLRWDYVDLVAGRARLPDSKTGAKTIHLNALAVEVLTALPRTSAWVFPGADLAAALVNLRKPWLRIREAATVRLWSADPSSPITAMIAGLRDHLERMPNVAECQDAAALAGIALPPGLTDVRLHDLRHSFASVGAAKGLSLPVIGALLGHTQPVTTQRYAHLAASPLRQAADVIGLHIQEVFRLRIEKPL